MHKCTIFTNCFAMLIRFVVQQSGNARYACWSFICLPRAFFRSFLLFFYALAEFAFPVFVVVAAHWFLFAFFAIRSFCLWLRQFTTIWTECQGEWREESKLLTALQLCTVGQIEKTSKRRAINGINRSPSSRQRAHINSTPGNTCVVSFHHARTMTLMVASVIDCNNESNKRCRFKLLHIDLCVI